MYRVMIVVAASFSTTVSGCAVYGLQDDQDRIRHALLDLYTNQIMDNLIRQQNGLPIVQLDYGNASTQITLKDSTSLTDGLATVNPGILSVIAGSTATVVKSTINTATGNLTADRANQVSVTATPVTTNDDVYAAYREFLAIPGSLQATCTPPPRGAAHLCKKCGRTYYWVPSECKRAFLALALATTAQRAQPLAGPDTFYMVNIIDVLRIEPAPIKVMDEKGKTQTTIVPTIVAKIDIKVPVDLGRIEITSPAAATKPSSSDGKSTATGDSASDGKGGGGSKTAVLKIAVDDKPDAQRVVQQSDQIRIFFDTGKAAGVFTSPQQLPGMLPIAAKLYLQRHRPLTPTGTEALNRIEFQLQQIQFNQMRSSP